MASESGRFTDWVRSEFSEGWASEVMPGLAAVPPTVLLAWDRETGKPAGFCCWDCTARGFLGPVGVDATNRGAGVGKMLVLGVLHEMRRSGYGYAIVGAAGPVDFFRSVCGAVEIPCTSVGIYAKGLKWK